MTLYVFAFSFVHCLPMYDFGGIMYKQIYHNLIICCINDNIVKLFLGMFKYESTTCYLHDICKLFDVQCCQSVNRSMIRYVGRLDNYVNCITCRPPI